MSDPEQIPEPPLAEQEPSGPELPLLVVTASTTGPTVTLRVGPPHVSLTWAGITVTDLPTQVPTGTVAGLYEAAGNAGVDLILEA